MIHRLKISILLAVAVACVSGVSASAASAAHFKAAKYTAKISAKQENNQGFQITGAISVCKKAKFTGELTGESETLSVTPAYSECTVELAGTHEAEVKTNECKYTFHAVAPGLDTGKVDIVCPAGKEIEVEVKGITGCFIKIGSQEGLGNVEYQNEAGTVKVKANITSIKWSTTPLCNLKPSEGTNGEYREGIFNGLNEPELGPVANPAKAIASGKFGTEADSIEVS